MKHITFLSSSKPLHPFESLNLCWRVTFNFNQLTTKELTTFTYTETMSGPGQMCSTVTPTSPNMSSQRLDQALSSIVSELTVSERSTSRWRARHTTARDDRVSSTAMGLVAMGFISLVMLFILGVDAVALYRRQFEGVGG